MKTPRSEAKKRVQQHLSYELATINRKIWNNKYEFRKLGKEQTILKREKTELYELINYLEKSINIEVIPHRRLK